MRWQPGLSEVLAPHDQAHKAEANGDQSFRG
jgi:hypothetical protein